MHDIKIIGIDLDGTLLNKGKKVSEQDKAAIRECIQKGIHVYLISGRPYSFTKYIAQTIAEEVQVISANGGLYEIGNRIKEFSIETKALDTIIDCLRDSTAHAFFKSKLDFYTHEPYDNRFLYDHMNDVFPSTLQVCSYSDMSWDTLKQEVHDIVKILVYDMDEHQLCKLRNKIECIETITVTDYQSISFDITGNQVNKGLAIRDVIAHFGYKKENFMAIGDAHNDMPMFKEAGLKVAMGNALDEIKAYCDIITNDHEHSGVAKAINEQILTKE